MSNFPLRYKLSWLPRLLKPSLGGDRRGLLPAEGSLLSPLPATVARLVFLGDISAVASREAPEVDERLRLLIASADLVVGNCEAPVVERARRPFRTAAGTHHAMTAGFLSDALGAAGIDRKRLVLSLANNHMLDQGIDGFAETQAALAGMGIETIGAAEDGLVRRRVLGGLTVGLAAFSEWRNASRQDFAGARDHAGRSCAWTILPRCRRAAADLTCVVAHWDWEFRHFPRPPTRALARRLAGRGAGLVVGHHAHVLQPAERLGRTLVAYGLGDFLGTALARQPWPGRLGGDLRRRYQCRRRQQGAGCGLSDGPLHAPSRRRQREAGVTGRFGRAARRAAHGAGSQRSFPSRWSERASTSLPIADAIHFCSSCSCSSFCLVLAVHSSSADLHVELEVLEILVVLGLAGLGVDAVRCLDRRPRRVEILLLAGLPGDLAEASARCCTACRRSRSD